MPHRSWIQIDSCLKLQCTNSGLDMIGTKFCSLMSPSLKSMKRWSMPAWNPDLGFSGNGREGSLNHVQGVLNQHGYHSVLMRRVVPSGQWLIGENFISQQDNDPNHSSQLSKNYLNKKVDGIHSVTAWPAQSLDLNPIELVWGNLDLRVYWQNTAQAAQENFGRKKSQLSAQTHLNMCKNWSDQ